MIIERMGFYAVIMRRHIASAPTASLSLGACEHGQPVDNGETALAIGQKICEVQWADWIREHGLGEWTIEPGHWHVGLKGDQWEVWTDGKYAGLGDYIPRSGEQPSQCEDILEQAFFRK